MNSTGHIASSLSIAPARGTRMAFSEFVHALKEYQLISVLQGATSCCLVLPNRSRLLPATYQERTFAEWGKRFGALPDCTRRHSTHSTDQGRVYAQFFNTPVIFSACGDRAALLTSEARSTQDDRSLLGWTNVLLMSYTEQWMRHRRWMQSRQEIQKLLHDLIRDPGDVLAHVKRYTAALMLGIGYGYSPTSEQAIRLLGGGGPGSLSLTSFLLVLRHLPAWMPGMEFKRRGIHMERIPLERVKRNMTAGTATPCVATTLLEEVIKGGMLSEADEKEISMTSAILAGFLLAMILHPNVVGEERLPEPRDRTALPYLEAVLTEVYRHTPLLTESDEYAGYDMPKGSVVIGNVWAMSRDEDSTRIPTDSTRQILNVSAETAETRDPRNFVFGFGRRMCPGRVLADSSIFHAASNLAAVFNIRQASGPDGKPIPVAVAFTSGAVRGRSHIRGRNLRQRTVVSEYKSDSP
ncbi:cytochrome P450 [Fomitopsis serialis]|uniref:cytochrome P450 n=1 Tax=Fomitopsis serialis TaxID=139415 RepID=UPI0020079263|nr:cytochrome P450 [Neoantrodia serialis]KAH9919733.1 cytochrome P450 [Neoantrodia serialis]